MDKSFIEEIVVVGGSSRVIEMQNILSNFFNGKDLNRTMNPDEAEVSGLAIKAAIMSGDTSSRTANEILDLAGLPLTIGVRTKGGVMSPIVKRNTTVPTKKSCTLHLNNSTDFLYIYEGERAHTKDNRLLAKIELSALRLPGPPVEVPVECTIDINYANYQAFCTLEEKTHRYSIKVELNSHGRLSQNELQRLLQDAVWYKMIDDAEAKRVSVRNGLDSRIASLLQTLRLEPSAQVEGLLKLTKEIREWADNSSHADVSEYRLQDQKLGEIEDAMVHRRPLAESLQQIRQWLGSSTSTPMTAAILKEVDGISAWLETVALAEPSEYSKRLERLGDINARLSIVTDLSGNGNDARKPEPTSTDYQDGEKVNDGSHIATQEMKADDESTVSGNAESSSQQFQAQHVPENETMESLFSRFHGTTRETLTDAQFERISTFLRNSGQVAWSNVPRLYTVLRLIGQLDAMESFVAQDITDICFPFTTSTLPSTLQPTTQFNFLEVQHVVLSKGFKLEKGADRQHSLFSQDEPLPFQVIGRLGRGAHGTVDKIMSTISYREYARKVFRKTRGLKREDIKTFITELTILKRVNHRHCVELVG